MAKRGETLEDLGRREAEYAKEREARLAERAEAQGRLSKDVPERFFKLCTDVRENVRVFNEATDPARRFTWRESPALAARDANLSGDFNCGFSRAGCDVNLSLIEMSRSGKPNVYIIEANGLFKDQSFLLRIEGYPDKGKTSYRMFLDLHRVPYGIDDLADRLVRAAVKLDYTTLTA
jgi:hypothetical protein